MKLTRLIAIGLTIGVTGCTPKPMDHNHEHPITISSLRPDAAMPYGRGYESLANQPPEKVATFVMEKFCSYSIDEYDSNVFVKDLQGVTTPRGWVQVSTSPSVLRPTLMLYHFQKWEEGGGTQQAEVTISNEEHPRDTENTWSRKIVCERQLDGFSDPVIDIYTVQLVKKEGQFRLDSIHLIESSL